MQGFIVHVFGKEGCSKCSALKRRLGDLLGKPEYGMFKMEYHDVLTLDGIVKFCKASCLNPNRIPAMLVEHDGRYMPNPISRTDSPDVYAAGCTYRWLGTQTDYDNGGGLITPTMIKQVLDEAKEIANGSENEEKVHCHVSAEEGVAAG